MNMLFNKKFARSLLFLKRKPVNVNAAVVQILFYSNINYTNIVMRYLQCRIIILYRFIQIKIRDKQLTSISSKAQSGKGM
jgi:hypothetical protein